MTKKQKKMLIRIIITIILMVLLHMAYEAFGAPADPVTGRTTSRWILIEPVWFILYMIPYLIIGHDILKKAFKGIMNRQVFDENFLMAIATLGAIGIALIKQNGEYTEAVAVMLFYQIGELFQSYAVGKSRRNISALMDIRPDHANLVTENGFETVDPDEVKTGSIILVQPGEKIPIDGRIVSGETTLNTSALTGESLPRKVEEGSEVLSGSINMSGVLKVRTTTEFDESTASKILDLVENAASRKSKSEKSNPPKPPDAPPAAPSNAA